MLVLSVSLIFIRDYYFPSKVNFIYLKNIIFID